jgi:formate dehydrogenase beta subunit
MSPPITVAKLIDTTTCIGCKACEVACQEWNEHEFRPSDFELTYQTKPDLEYDFWNIIKFNEVEREDKFSWNMAKYQCMHCVDPGCLAACPAPGAIFIHENGIVDFDQESCIGCGYCMTGCPFDVPRRHPKSKKVFKCTLCSDRTAIGLQPACIKACPTSCLSFGRREDLLRTAQDRVAELKNNGHTRAGVYNPMGVGGTNVLYVLADADNPETYGLPRDPKISGAVRFWQGPLKWVGSLMLLGGIAGVLLHYMRFGPNIAKSTDDPEHEPVRENLGSP